MGDVKKIVDKCKRCQAKLTKDEDVYCTACIEAEDDETAAENETKVEAEAQDEKAEKKGALLEIYVDPERGPICLMNDEAGVSPQMALQLLLYVTEDIRMSLQAARTARNVAILAKDAKTFGRVFKGANKLFDKK